MTAALKRSLDARARCRQVFPAAAGNEEPAALLSSGSESPGGPRRPLGVGVALQERVAALARGSGCAPGLGWPHEGHRMPARRSGGHDVGSAFTLFALALRLCTCMPALHGADVRVFTLG